MNGGLTNVIDCERETGDAHTLVMLMFTQKHTEHPQIHRERH